MKDTSLKPIHPGIFLMEDFMKPLGISQYRISKDINVPAIRISQIVNGKRSITPDTALRLGKYFKTTAKFWLNLQARYELEVLEDLMEDELKNKVVSFQPAM